LTLPQWIAAVMAYLLAIVICGLAGYVAYNGAVLLRSIGGDA
jgi:hypothetical protein